MPRPVEPGGTGSDGRIQVHPVDFAKLGVTIGNASWQISDTWSGLEMGAKGWAGGDQAAVTFSQAYDAGTGMAGDAFDTMEQATYTLGYALAQMALNYLTAEQASAIETGLTYYSLGQISSADPHLGGMAETIYQVLLQLANIAPTPATDWSAGSALGPPSSQADLVTVRQMGTWWHWMAGQLESEYGSCDSQVRAVAADNSGSDVTAMQAWWRSLYRPGDASTLLEGTRQLCAALGDFCDSYAGIIDHERSAQWAIIAQYRSEWLLAPQQLIEEKYEAALEQARQQAAAAVASSPQLARVQHLTGEVATAIDNNSGNIQTVAARTVAVPAPPAA